MEEMIKTFLRCSIKSDFNGFNFEEFFDEFMPILHEVLTRHGLTTFEDYMQWMQDMGDYSDADLEKYTLETDYVYYGPQQVREAIMKGQFEACKKVFHSTFSDLEELHKKLMRYSTELPLKDKIILFDECIHAQHCNGSVLDNLNESIDDIKEEIDQEYAEGRLS